MTSILLGLIFSFLFACGPENGKEGEVTLAMANQSTTLALLDEDDGSVVPDYFGLKVMQASLRYVEDINDTNAAPVYESAFYLNPTGCGAVEKTTTEKDDKEYEYYQPAGPNQCDAANMSLIDFARPTSEVNAELNAGQYPVIPGVYNKVTICFSSIYGVRVDDHQTAIAEIDTAGDTVTPFGCQDTVLENFEILEGERATVSLEYNLAESSVVVVENDYGTCTPSETTDNTYVCINGLNPTPYATKE